MIHISSELPSDWLSLVDSYNTENIKNNTERIIAIYTKKFILDKKETIIGARYVQVFLENVLNNNYDNLYPDFINIPDFVIEEAFSEIKGNIGLRFCEIYDSRIAELLAFQEVLKIEGFKAIQKQRENGSSDFFVKKYCLEYEVEVKFKMADQSFHDAITHLIMGYSMLSYAHSLVGKKVIVKIKLPANEINDKNKKRVYAKVENWCKSSLDNYSDDDLDIFIKDGNDNILKIECSDNARRGIIPKSTEVQMILKAHMQKIQKQFQKRKPKRSIGIIIWSTPWNYNNKDHSVEIEENIKNGIRDGLNDIGFVCDRLYVYSTGLKRSLMFKQTKS